MAFDPVLLKETLARKLPRRNLPSGAEARLLRQRARLTLKEFAAIVGCNWRSIIRWETQGDVPSPSLAQAYGDALAALEKVPGVRT